MWVASSESRWCIYMVSGRKDEEEEEELTTGVLLRFPGVLVLYPFHSETGQINQKTTLILFEISKVIFYP